MANAAAGVGRERVGSEASASMIAESPRTLVSIATEFIALNAHNGVIACKDDMFMHAEIAEMLLEEISAIGILNDHTISAFSAKNTRLTKVHMPEASYLTSSGLRTLREHRLTELTARGLAKATISDLIGALGESTLQSLRVFSVPDSTFMDVNKHAVMVPMSQLKNVTTLNVAGTEFNRTSLEMVVQDLPLLEWLNISRTKVSDYSSLRKIRNRLKYLSAHDVKLSPAVADATGDWLPELDQLRHLDVSVEVSDASVAGGPWGPINQGKIKTDKLLTNSQNFPKMVSLDLSGKDNISVSLLLQFLQSHPNLQFLGLSVTETCKDDIFTDPENRHYNPDLVVTGSATIDQVAESLRKYIGRMHYAQKALYYLFRLTQGLSEPKRSLIDVSRPSVCFLLT
jgi:Zyg-11 family protein